LRAPCLTGAFLTPLQLLEAEMAKEVKKPPVVEYMIPKRIFTKTDSVDEKDSLLVSLWDFGSS